MKKITECLVWDDWWGRAWGQKDPEKPREERPRNGRPDTRSEGSVNTNPCDICISLHHPSSPPPATIWLRKKAHKQRVKGERGRRIPQGHPREHKDKIANPQHATGRAVPTRSEISAHICGSCTLWRRDDPLVLVILGLVSQCRKKH